MPSIHDRFREFGIDIVTLCAVSCAASIRRRALAAVRLIGHWRNANDGAVAVEVGILALPFFTLLIGIVAIGFMTWCHSILDYATQKAARQLMTGAAQGNNTSASDFRTQTLCAYLPQSIFNCSNLVVNLNIVTESNEPTAWANYVKSDFSSIITPPLDNTKTNFCMGAGNTYQILEVLYPLPWYMGTLVMNPQIVQNQFVIMSTAAFKNEPFPGATSNPAGC